MELIKRKVEMMLVHGLLDEIYKVIDRYEIDNEIINKVNVEFYIFVD